MPETATPSLIAHRDQTRNRSAMRSGVRWLLLSVTLILIIFGAFTLGAPVPFSDLWSNDVQKADVARHIFWGLRPVRVLAGLLVGAALAVSGASLQAVFRNPLAEPYLLGISAGGALGAAIALALQSNIAFGLNPTPVFAFIGSLGAAAAVYVLGAGAFSSEMRGSAFDRARLLLVGVALSAFLAALMALVVTLSNRADIAQHVLFWTLGGLGETTRGQLIFLVVSLSCGILVILGSARDLNALRAGEEDAQSLGVDVSSLHRRLLVASALMSAAAVSTAGLIGFIGLLAPHLVRQVFGNDARVLIPASALGGAALLCGCDAIARSVARPVELPVGIVTALLGVPLFLWLARRA
jgi:iron complex transport system permease protein